MKSATVKRKSAKRWHFYYRNNVRILRDSEGRDWFGTRQEVRDAGIRPDLRDSLARTLRLIHSIYAGFGEYDPANLRIQAQNARMEVIMHDGCADRVPVLAERDDFILMLACARFMERTFDGYIDECSRGGIESVIEQALSDGLPKLPLTRQERAAFRGRQSDYCRCLYLREKGAAQGGAVHGEGVL